jgi:hypothetical protein
MKRHSRLIAALLGATMAFPGFAQEKPKAEGGEKPAETRKAITPLRVQVMFNEFEGEKKISSLPYTLLVNSDAGVPIASIRMGLRVPIHTKDSAVVTYVDMGTNLDGRAEKQDDGRFLVSLSVERASAYSPQGSLPDTKAVGSDSPVIQQFRSQVNLLIRDGQTIQSTVSTDPVTGRVIKVDVSVNVVK